MDGTLGVVCLIKENNDQTLNALLIQKQRNHILDTNMV